MGSPRMCLYEILGVARDAIGSEIKKAYRTQALANHPDKNPGQEEQASEKFKLVQHAYSVLSDEHERAWYDAHRTQIMRGYDPSNEKDAPADPAAATDVDIFACFTSAAFDGFNDSPDGFYTFYQDVFDRLWEEEVEVMANDKERKGVPAAAPFGASDSSWDTVRDFYRLWEPFSSRKTFSFADKWNLADGPNREYRRHMEKENKKERSRVRKEFNSTVRELVAFVKKRDPRVAARRAQEEKERAQKQKEASEKEKVRLQQRKENAALTRAARDEALEEDAAGLDEILASIALDERIERNGRKNSRRRQQNFSDSERSVDRESDADNAGSEQLSSGEDLSIEVEGNGISHGRDDEHEDYSQEEPQEDLYCVACRKPFRTSAQKIDHERSKKHRAAMAKLKKQVLQEEEEFEAAETGRQKKSKPQAMVPSEEDERGTDQIESDIEERGSAIEVVTETFVKLGTSKKKQKKRSKKLGGIHAEPDAEDSGIIPANEQLQEASITLEDSELLVGKDESTAPEEETKLSKKQKRRLREQKKKEQKDEAGNVEENRSLLSCNVCDRSFPSRTKLMKHVNSAGHALHILVKSGSSRH